MLINQKAQTLIEVLVALGLVAVISVTVLGVMVEAQIINLSTKQRVEANVLSGQLIEQSRSARDQLWGAEAGKKYYFTINDDNNWQLEEGEFIDEPYTSWLEIEPVKRDGEGNISDEVRLIHRRLRL